MIQSILLQFMTTGQVPQLNQSRAGGQGQVLNRPVSYQPFAQGCRVMMPKLPINAKNVKTD